MIKKNGLEKDMPEYETVILPRHTPYEHKEKHEAITKFMDDLVSKQAEAAKEAIKANRYNEGKLDWDLIDFEALIPVVKGFMYGEKKYSRHQWKKGLDEHQIMNSLLRHAFAIKRGELIDPESGVEHIGLLGCNMVMLSHFHQKSKINDNKKDENPKWVTSY